jgi:hypothetical protein
MMKFLSILLVALAISINCIQAQQCSFQQNTDYFGADIGFAKNINSIDACCELCSAVPGCQAWTHVSVSNLCYVKFAIGQVRQGSVGSNSLITISI